MNGEYREKSVVGVLLLLVVVGCGVSEGRSVEGHTFRELTKGVKADPAHFEMSHECVEKDDSVDGSVYYDALITLTNTDDRQRSFSVSTKVPSYGDEGLNRSPVEWQLRGETVELATFLGWQDDFPDGCPGYVVVVYQNPAEALVEGKD